MDQSAYDALLSRLVAVSERQDDRQADIQSLLASLNTKYQRMDVSLTSIDEAMGKQTTILEEMKDTLKALAGLLTRHEATFERLGRLLDERLPPPADGH